MNTSKYVDMNGDGTDSDNNAEEDARHIDNDCGKRAVNGDCAKVPHHLCNIPNGGEPSSSGSKVNNGAIPKASTSRTFHRHHPSIDTYLLNNVNDQCVDKCALKTKCDLGVRKNGINDDDTSSQSGNEAEDNLSTDECIYTYKGDQLADLPSNFLGLEAAGGDNHQPPENGANDDNEARLSGSSSPEMDYLEMDFDPGPSCEQDSADESEQEENSNGDVFPPHLAQDSSSSDEEPGPPMNDLNIIPSNDLNRPASAEITLPSPPPPPPPPPQLVTSPSSPISSQPGPSHMSYPRPWLPRDSCGVHMYNGDLGSPSSIGGDGSDSDPESTSNLQAHGPCKDTKKYNLHPTRRYDQTIGKSMIDSKNSTEGEMIWSETEACANQVLQIATSACGATAVINTLNAFEMLIDIERIKSAVATKQRANNAALVEYLFSRSCAGATFRDIERGLKVASDGKLITKFFSFYPEPAISLSHWLADWIRKGAVPIVTLNLQRGVVSGQLIPDAWHHQMVFGVGPKGIYLTNPIECVPEAALWPQLTSPSELLIRRGEILSRWDSQQTELKALTQHPDPRWRSMNVLGQVVHLLREAHGVEEHSRTGPPTRTHVRIPAVYTAGVLLVIRRSNEASHELRNAPPLPLLSGATAISRVFN